MHRMLRKKSAAITRERTFGQLDSQERFRNMDLPKSQCGMWCAYYEDGADEE